MRQRQLDIVRPMKDLLFMVEDKTQPRCLFPARLILLSAAEVYCRPGIIKCAFKQKNACKYLRDSHGMKNVA